MQQIIFSAMLCLAAFANALAQTGEIYHIVNEGDMYTTYTIGSVEMAELEKTVDAKTLRSIVAKAHEDAYPSGISSLASWNTNRANFQYYQLRKKGTIDGGKKVVLEVVPSENKNMPADMQATESFFFILGKDAVAAGAPKIKGVATASTKSGGNKYFNVPCTINEAGDLKSTFNFDDTDALSSELDIPEAMVKDIVDYGNEDNWPSGISTFEARQTTRELMKNYHLYLVGKIGENQEDIILYCPKSENQHVQSNLRPTHDLYFVYKSTGVTVNSANNASRNTSNASTASVEITDAGSLMSTFNFKNSRDTYQKALGVNSARMQDIIDYGTENNWPSGINTLTARDLTRELMKGYNLEFVGFLDDGKTAVLYCAKAKNQHVQANMRPSHDLYFAYQAAGVKILK